MSLFETFFTRTTEGNQVKLFLLLSCGYLLAQFAYNWRDQWRFHVTARELWQPVKVLGLFQIPHLKPREFALAGMVFGLSLICICFGFYPRLFLGLAILAYFFYFGQILQLSYVRRKTNIIPVVLLFLLVAPGLDAPLNQENVLWPIQMIQLAATLVYFSSAVMKLRHGGWRWGDGRTLQAALLTYYLQFDIGPALALARFPLVCRLLSILIWFVEGTFWIVLFVPALTPYYMAVMVGFHLSSSILFHIHYLKYFTMVYFAFFTDWAYQVWRQYGG